MTSTSRATRRVALRDRRWIAGESVRIVGPVAAITASGLRDALCAWHRAAPRSPVVCRLDRAAERWVELTQHEFLESADELIVDLDQPEPASVVRRLIEIPLGDRPAVLAASAGFAAIKVSHAVGDGRVLNTVFPELLHGAVTGQVPQPSPASVRMPLLRGAARHFGRDPRRLVSVLRTPRPVLPAGSAGLTRPWRPAWAQRWARSDHATVQRVRAWRDRHAPGVSAASLLFAAVFSAFRSCGFGTGMPGLMVPVDARRYLPGRITLDGNFAAGQYISPTDPADPRAVQDALDQAIRSGRPLTTLALHNLYRLLGREDTTQPTQVSTQPQPQLTLTHLGRLSGYADLPWAGGPHGRLFLTAQRPGEPENMTVSIAELDGALHVSASFHDTTFDPKSVARALSLLCDDPIALVTQPAPH